MGGLLGLVTSRYKNRNIPLWRKKNYAFALPPFYYRQNYTGSFKNYAVYLLPPMDPA